MSENNPHYVLIRLPEVLKITGLSRSFLYLKINKNSKYFDASFPKPVPLSSTIRGGVAWVLGEIHAWVLSRLSARAKRKN